MADVNAAATSSRRVLLVDDNEDIRVLMRLAIQRDGRFEVCGEATNGEEAIARCGELHPDAVLLDLLMPVMDGYTALPQIRSRCPETDVIVFSAVPSLDARQRAAALGARSFIEKTADATKVLDALAAVFDLD